MRPVYITSEHLLTSLGFTVEEHLYALKKGESGIKLHSESSLSEEAVCISKVDADRLGEYAVKNGGGQKFTYLEQMMFCSIQEIINKSGIKLSDKRTLLVLSTTKGNIDLLEKREQGPFPPKHAFLSEVATTLGQFFNCVNQPLVVSNACISGALGIIIGKRLIEQGKYDHVLVCGADIASKFVISGFQSLKAMSEKPCRPYDEERDGISLGEGCASILLSSQKRKDAQQVPIRVLGGASSNDANHISGPSRTGEGLFQAIQVCLKGANMSPEKVDFISAHGTATRYNDEMESIAFQRSGLLDVPVNSFKGYIGHTLGAAGTIESALSILSMQTNLLFESLGYNKHGVSNPMNIIQQTTQKDIQICLKTASGFGGCNAAVLFAKES